MSFRCVQFVRIFSKKEQALVGPVGLCCVNGKHIALWGDPPPNIEMDTALRGRSTTEGYPPFRGLFYFALSVESNSNINGGY